MLNFLIFTPGSIISTEPNFSTSTLGPRNEYEPSCLAAVTNSKFQLTLVFSNDPIILVLLASFPDPHSVGKHGVVESGTMECLWNVIISMEYRQCCHLSAYQSLEMPWCALS
jgi:hypothetical protein